MTPRRVLLAWFAAMIAVHAVVGLWQPLTDDDWLQLTWVADHGSWLAGHFTAADIASYVFAESTVAFAAISALASAALVLGAFVLAARRLPRATWDDTLGVVAISAMIWIIQPRAGFVWFHRPYVAAQVIGCAAAVWFLAPLRCGWRLGRLAPVLLAIAGLIAGTSTRQIALASLVAAVVALRKAPADERRGYRIAVVALAVGTVIGFFDPPYVELLRVLNRGIEPNLLLLNLPLRNAAGMTSLILLLVITRLALAAWRPSAVPSDGDALPAPRETRAWFFTWVGLCALALIGPRYGEATLLPATIVLAIGALPYVRWLCQIRALRLGLVALFVVVHAAFWAMALTTFDQLHREFEDRIAQLRATPPGEVAVIAPYSQIQPNPWFFGEDWKSAARQLTGIDVFGVRDIEFVAGFHGYEHNAEIALHAELRGLDDARRAAVVPRLWATDVAAAREQLVRLARQVRATAGVEAHLIVDDPRLAFAERGGRPLEIGWLEHDKLTAPLVTRATAVDANNRLRIISPSEIATELPEAYQVYRGRASHLSYVDSSYRIQPTTTELYAVVLCNATRCLLLDAFKPTL